MNKLVLISINSSWNIVHFRAALVRALSAQGYSLHSAAPEDTYTVRLRTMVETHTPLPMDNAGTSPLRDMLLWLRYLHLLRRLRPAVMLTYTIKPNIYGAIAARMLGIPVITNVSGLGTAFIRRTWLTRVVAQLYRVAFAHAACVFFQNPHDRDLFIRMHLVAPEKAALLNGSGVDLEYFHPRHNVAPAADAPITFVLIARLLWDKGIGEYVAAARIVKARYPNALFRLVGPLGVANQTAINASMVASWVAEGLIDYRGQTDDVRDVMAHHDCIVLPSYREGMSRVLIEAAAMGKPMITTDVAGCADIVTHGENGLLCAAQDTEILAQRMMEFLRLSPEQRAAMGIKSREKAVRDFNEQQVITAYIAAINAATKSA